MGEGVRPRKKFPFFFLVLFTISFDLRHISSKIEASLSEQKNHLPFLGAVIHQLLATRESGNGQNKYFSLLSSILGGRVAKKKRAEGFNCWQKFAWWMRRSGCHRIIPRMNLAVGWWMNAWRLLVITLFFVFRLLRAFSTSTFTFCLLHRSRFGLGMRCAFSCVRMSSICVG